MVLGAALASAQQVSRVEVGVQTGVLVHNIAGRVILDNFRFNQLVPRAAIGGRFTYNAARTFALEGEFDFVPDRSGYRTSLEGGHALLFLAGPKAGIRRRNFGVFGKARVGILSFSSTYDISHGWDPLGPVQSALRSSYERRTHLALDLGGALEYYPSKRLILRADASELIVKYRDTLVPILAGPLGDSGHVASNILLTAGIGYRVGSLVEGPEAVPQDAPRFELGLHLSGISIEQNYGKIRSDPGAGVRFTWNFSRVLAVDTAFTFFPPRTFFDRIPGPQTGGSIIQLVTGIKAGVRRERWGVFAKFRPGLMSYSRTLTAIGLVEPIDRKTHWALDMGGVLEWYPTRRTIARLDIGDTTVFLRPTQLSVLNSYNVTYPSSTHTAMQVSTGFGFRF